MMVVIILEATKPAPHKAHCQTTPVPFTKLAIFYN